MGHRTRPRARRRSGSPNPNAWSATRAARTAVNGRDQIADWHDPNSDDPATVNVALHWGRLQAEAVTFHDLPANNARIVMGVDVPADATAEDGVRAHWQRMVAGLRTGLVHTVSPDMMPALLAATSTLTLDDARLIHESDAAPSRSGIVFFPEPVQVIYPTHDPDTNTIIDESRWVSAVSWGPGGVAPTDVCWRDDDDLDPDPAEGRGLAHPTPPLTDKDGLVVTHLPQLDENGLVVVKPTIRVVAWVHIPSIPPGPRSDYDGPRRAAQRAGGTVPDWFMAQDSPFPVDGPVDLNQLVPDKFRDQVTDVLQDAVVKSSWWSGQQFPDPESTFPLRLIAAFWRLAEQRISVSTQPRRPRDPNSEDAPRSRKWEHVSVVRLRRQHHPDRNRDDTDEVPVVWKHRWVVQMHKRRQWYPSLGVHKVIFVGPYVKGPEDAPMKPTAEQVRTLVR